MRYSAMAARPIEIDARDVTMRGQRDVIPLVESNEQTNSPTRATSIPERGSRACSRRDADYADEDDVAAVSSCSSSPQQNNTDSDSSSYDEDKDELLLLMKKKQRYSSEDGALAAALATALARGRAPQKRSVHFFSRVQLRPTPPLSSLSDAELASMWHCRADYGRFTHAEIDRRKALGIVSTSLIMPMAIAHLEQYDDENDDDDDEMLDDDDDDEILDDTYENEHDRRLEQVGLAFDADPRDWRSDFVEDSEPHSDTPVAVAA